MSTAVDLFTYPDGPVAYGIRVIHDAGPEPIWIGREVCDVLGISKYRDAISQLDGDERVSVAVDTPGGVQQMLGVTEAGIYSLMLISRSPKVKQFKRWLTHEVLPTLRRSGSYTAIPQNYAEALRAAADAHERAEAAESKARELAVPASAWNELAEAAGDYSVADAAKVLSRDPNITTGERRLFASMQYFGWIFRDGGRWRAYQRRVEDGRLVEKVGKPYVRNGEMCVAEPTVRVTPKGLASLHKLLGGSGQLALVAVS
jgi:prophage antirepressor-like protein